MTLASHTLAGQFNPFNGFGQANIGLAFFGNGLCALVESDLPYSARLTPDGDIETLGRHDFDGVLSVSMTAHPKVDPETGEAYAYNYNPFFPPFQTFFKFDREGVKHTDMPVLSLSCPPFIHDFAITRKYTVFPDTQMGVNPMGVVLGGSLVGLNPRKVPRIGIVRRDAGSGCEMRWFDVPGCNIMHIVNAWDEEDDDGNDVVVTVASNIMSAEHFLERLDLVHGLMEKITINLKDGRASRRPISAMNLDLPAINPAYIGKYSRYVYAGIADPMPKMSVVGKLDLAKRVGIDRCVVTSRNYGPGSYGGEPFFVARDPEHPEAKEDDGHIVSHVHDEKVSETRFLMMDAKSPDLNVVAAVRLPQHVPYGFHGIFVRDSDLS
ncbi:probable carotenoid cleavage dioxygenase 4, chloroplastic [Rhodamnia argentea]|uniref:Probable carotenoid cleavage dioxygenase 4, chloroplastic n=1 Tax=Rhodamnia argentea TaxID=178133 RepID=A0ABM3HXA6_9MYRT|nr:probable carotenoid cleavage dioxygenase 4, chloroplastic [Rhodamnia argentea]